MENNNAFSQFVSFDCRWTVKEQAVEPAFHRTNESSHWIHPCSLHGPCSPHPHWSESWNPLAESPSSVAWSVALVAPVLAALVLALMLALMLALILIESYALYQSRGCESYSSALSVSLMPGVPPTEVVGALQALQLVEPNARHVVPCHDIPVQSTRQGPGRLDPPNCLRLATPTQPAARRSRRIQGLRAKGDLNTHQSLNSSIHLESGICAVCAQNKHLLKIHRQHWRLGVRIFLSQPFFHQRTGMKVKAFELENKSKDEIEKTLESLKQELASARVQQVSGQQNAKVSKL